jgi:hypothetical protein
MNTQTSSDKKLKISNVQYNGNISLNENDPFQLIAIVCSTIGIHAYGTQPLSVVLALQVPGVIYFIVKKLRELKCSDAKKDVEKANAPDIKFSEIKWSDVFLDEHEKRGLLKLKGFFSRTKNEPEKASN